MQVSSFSFQLFSVSAFAFPTLLPRITRISRISQSILQEATEERFLLDCSHRFHGKTRCRRPKFHLRLSAESAVQFRSGLTADSPDWRRWRSDQIHSPFRQAKGPERSRRAHARSYEEPKPQTAEFSLLGSLEFGVWELGHHATKAGTGSDLRYLSELL